MRALLSLCSGRAAGADGRSRRVLRGNCQRGRAPVPARHRFDRAERPGHLSPRDEADRDRIRRSCRVLSVEDHAAGRRRTRHRASDPAPQARTQRVALPVDLTTGDRLAYGGARAFVEHFRLDRQGQLEDTQYRLVSRGEIYAYRDGDTFGEGERPPGWTYDDSGVPPPSPWRMPPRPRLSPWGGIFGDPYGWWNDGRPRPRRVDPDYLWGNRGF